jgi:hypothetical protein
MWRGFADMTSPCCARATPPAASKARNKTAMRMVLPPHLHDYIPLKNRRSTIGALFCPESGYRQCNRHFTGLEGLVTS